MRTEVLQYLIEVDKAQSLSKAAHNLFISKSALSENISAIEQKLNVQIFTRSKKTLVTTATGKKIIQQAKIILEDIEKLYSLSDQAPALVDYSETVRFGLGFKFAKTGLNSCLSIIMQKYPNLLLHSAFMNYTECMEALEHDEIDFSITSYPAHLNQKMQALFSARSISVIPLHNDPTYCLVNANSPLTNKATLTSKDFVGQTMLTFNNTILEELHNTNQKVIFVTDLENILQLVEDNIGISPLPFSMIRNSLSISHWKNINVVPVTDWMQYNCIIHSSKKPLTNAQLYFIDLYKRTFEKSFVD